METKATSEGSLSNPVLRVLVVEDDIHLREVIMDFLEMHHMRVECAGDGMNAVELVSRNHYDVVVSDIRLPSMYGTGVARSIQTLPHPPAVILMTAYPDWWTAREALSVGVERVMTKPFDLHALVHAVEHACRGPRGDGRDLEMFKEGSD
jgi:DNA-binding response OmpR family regulator